jgi:2-desacetyl-2-hydroxyethyl bacteriochlorophyllide A dehydrogenase
MKAAVYEGVRDIKLKERPDLKAGPGEVIVKIKYCGICGTDVHAYLHEGMTPTGIVMGHENCGTIAQVGKGVEGWKVGDRVVAGPPGPCGKCYYCIHGQPTICVNGLAQTNGLRRDGGMAEYMLVKDPSSMLFKIPDSVSFEDAALFDIVAVSLRGIRQSRFRVGDNVVVAGAGAIGLSAIQLLRIAGARHITVIQPSPKKREMAIKFGADLAFNPMEEGEKLEKKVKALYGGIGADVAFEAAGTPDAFQSCIQLVRGGGQVLVLGVATIPTPIIEIQLVVNEIDMRATLAYSADDVNIFLDLVAQKRFNTAGIVSDIIKLDDIVEKGFERLANTKGLVKILVAP